MFPRLFLSIYAIYLASLRHNTAEIATFSRLQERVINVRWCCFCARLFWLGHCRTPRGADVRFASSTEGRVWHRPALSRAVWFDSWCSCGYRQSFHCGRCWWCCHCHFLWSILDSLFSWLTVQRRICSHFTVFIFKPTTFDEAHIAISL